MIRWLEEEAYSVQPSAYCAHQWDITNMQDGTQFTVVVLDTEPPTVETALATFQRLTRRAP